MLRVSSACVVVALSFTATACSMDKREHVAAGRQSLATAEQRKLVAPDAAQGDTFGNAIALSGNTAIVGSWRDDDGSSVDQGSAYVFVRSGSTWSFQQKLSAGGSHALFGAGVAVAGDVAVVTANSGNQRPNGSRGAAHVFQRSGSSWTRRALIEPTSPAPNEVFGDAVAMSEHALLIGGDAIYFFARNGSEWTERQRFEGRATTVALSGETAVVGDRGADVGANAAQGAARVFVRSGATWTEQQRLTASDGEQDDRFGTRVAISGDVIVIGDAEDRIGGVRRGSAYFFRRSGTTWTEEQKVVSSDGIEEDNFGSSVAVMGELAVIGASQHEHGGANANHGAVYVFVRSGTTWVEDHELRALDAQNNDLFGGAVAMAGSTLLVGADNDDAPGIQAQGSVYAFVFRGAIGDPCSADSGCESGFCSDGRCCDTACDGSCNVCSLAAGAPRDGECVVLPAGSEGSPPCAPFICSGAGPLCEAAATCGSCTSDLDCAAGEFCGAIGLCQPQKAQGRACEPQAGADCRFDGCRVCASGACVDGFCCNTQCSGSCSACANFLTGAPNGTCASKLDCAGSGGNGGADGTGGTAGTAGSGGGAAGSAGTGTSGAGAAGGTTGGTSSGGASGSSGTGGGGGSALECVHVAPDGNDAAAVASNGVLSFRNVQPAIDFADTHRDLTTAVCIAQGSSCRGGVEYPGPAGAHLTMRPGISVTGHYDSTDWSLCDFGVTVISPQTQLGVLFPPEIDVETTLAHVSVEAFAAETTAAVTIDGARGVLLERVEVTDRDDWPATLPHTVIGFDVKNGAEVSLLRSHPRALGGLIDGVALRSFDSRVQARETMMEATGSRSVYGALLVDSPRSTFERCHVTAEDRSSGNLATAEAFSLTGDATDVVVRGSTFIMSGGFESAGISLAECGGTAARFESNFVQAVGARDESRIGVWGVRSAADCPAVLTRNDIRIEFGNEQLAIGVECGKDCRVIENSVTATNRTVVRGGGGELFAVSCTDCLEVSDNHISGIGSILPRLGDFEYESVGLRLAGSGTLVDGNYIDGGCSGGVGGGPGSFGIAAFGAVRIQNNIVNGGHDCDELAGTANTTGIWIGGPGADLHSNFIHGGQPSTDPCTSVGIVLTEGGSASIRNNILELGACGSGAHIFETTPNADPIVLENNDFVPRADGSVLYVDQGTVDPKTIDAINALPDIPASGNFSVPCAFPIDSSSPCNGRGTPTDAPLYDVHGDPRSTTAPDVGPDEWPGECESGFCQNGGTCVAGGPRGYTCRCPPSITGDDCEIVFTDVEVGQGFTCGLRNDGQLVCWGANLYGQLDAPAGSFRALSSGHLLSCALRTDDTLACWGWTNQGILNHPTGMFDRIVATSDYACAVQGVQPTCWGSFSHGSPVETFSLIEIGGWHSCGIRPDGTVGCWGLEGGLNDVGQASPPPGTFSALALGVYSSCGIRQSDGRIECWGDMLIGDPVPSGPVQAVELTFTGAGCAIELDGHISCFGTGYVTPPAGTFRSFALGPYHGCAIRTDHRVICWGQNASGETTPPY